MTDILSPASPEDIRRQLLSVVKSVKGQIRNAENLYVSVDLKKPRLQSAPAVPETEDSWHGLHTAAAGCERCALSKTRRNVVFGDGNRSARLVFVGEAPGADEDQQGLPFVGRAGQLLTNIIRAMGLERKDVYICNILKCRPPGNRQPQPDEAARCREFLDRQIELVSPRVICLLGGIASHFLLDDNTPVGRMRGRWFDYRGIPVRVTYHPAYLLRNYTAEARKKVWDDVLEVVRKLRELRQAEGI